MPQISLLDDHTPTMGDLTIRVKPAGPLRETTEVVVSVGRTPKDPPMPVWVGTLPAIETDMLTTLVTDALTSWAYGERIKEVRLACASVKKMASAHAAAHQF